MTLNSSPESTDAIPNATRGNHETMMMAARNGGTDARRWMLSGGSETRDSYNGPNGRIAQLGDVPKSHWEFLSERLALFGWIIFQLTSDCFRCLQHQHRRTNNFRDA